MWPIVYYNILSLSFFVCFCFVLFCFLVFVLFFVQDYVTLPAPITIGGNFSEPVIPPYNGIQVNVGNETRYDWNWNHPLLISEASFSVATVLTCMSIWRNLVIFEFVGPLEVRKYKCVSVLIHSSRRLFQIRYIY